MLKGEEAVQNLGKLLNPVARLLAVLRPKQKPSTPPTPETQPDMGGSPPTKGSNDGEVK